MAAVSSSAPVLSAALLPPDLVTLEKMKEFEPKIHAIFARTLETQRHEKVRVGQEFTISVDRIIPDKGVSCLLTCGGGSQYGYRISQPDVNQFKQLDSKSDEADTIIQRIVNSWFEVKLWREYEVVVNPGDICHMIVVREKVAEDTIILREKIYKYMPQSALLKISQTEKDIKNTMELGISYRRVLDCFAKKDILDNEPEGSYLLLGKTQTLRELQMEAFSQFGGEVSNKNSKSCIIL